MLSEPSFCHVIERSRKAGGMSLLAVKLVNSVAIQRSTSIPTSTLAAKRFEAAVMTSSTAWIAAGWLSHDIVGTIFRSDEDNIGAAVSESMRRYGFDDPWSGSGLVELQAVIARVNLDQTESVADACTAIARLLGEKYAGLDPHDFHNDEAELWCAHWDDGLA